MATTNEQLLQGPDLTISLVGVVIWFRQEPAAIMVDMEAMFHQVKVPEDDWFTQIPLAGRW